MTASIRPHPRELRLQRHELVQITHAPSNTTIQCGAGILWITCSGDRRQDDCPDILLSAGERYVPAPNSHVVIEAMRDARLSLTQA
jgi:hypothetical protein